MGWVIGVVFGLVAFYAVVLAVVLWKANNRAMHDVAADEAAHPTEDPRLALQLRSTRFMSKVVVINACAGLLLVVFYLVMILLSA
jgi:hypothetical protein